jgi:hypothetical protein
MHECNAHFCVLSISSLRSWDVTCGIGHEPSLVRHFLPARREILSCKLPSLQGGEAFTSFSLQREKATPGARQRLAGGTACRGFCRMHRPWTPSRKWLRAKRYHHGRASADVSRGSLMTSLRSSVAGATLCLHHAIDALTRWGSPLAFSHLP